MNNTNNYTLPTWMMVQDTVYDTDLRTPGPQSYHDQRNNGLPISVSHLQIIFSICITYIHTAITSTQCPTSSKPIISSVSTKIGNLHLYHINILHSEALFTFTFVPNCSVLLIQQIMNDIEEMETLMDPPCEVRRVNEGASTSAAVTGMDLEVSYFVSTNKDTNIVV